MAEYIEREALIKEIGRRKSIARTSFPKQNFCVNDVLHCVYDAPTADVVEVVRCKDCKHYEIHKPSVLENCERNGAMLPMKPSDFCSYAERKDGADNE